MILSLLVPVILARSMDLNGIVQAQPVAFIVAAPIAALIFFVTSVAEVGRTPFDLLEAESEIVAGFHIEYSGMKFGMFFVAEFLHAFTVGALTAVLFLGGWRGPFADQVPLLGALYFMLKAFVGYFIVILMRSALPRIRIDHMLDLNWKFLVPTSLSVIVVTIVVDKLIQQAGITNDWARSGLLFLSNVLLGLAIFGILSRSARRMRVLEEMDAGEHGAGHTLAGHAEPAEAAAHGAQAAPAH
jgi:NADH-quinone oxidoreductase subunit H